MFLVFRADRCSIIVSYADRKCPIRQITLRKEAMRGFCWIFVGQDTLNLNIEIPVSCCFRSFMAVAEDRRYNAEGGLGGTDITRNAEYNIALSRVRLEKRYASVAAESMLRKNDPDKEPTAEQISKCADRLRKDERFSAFIKEKEGKLSEYDEFQNAMK